MFIIVGQLIYFSLGYQVITFIGGLGIRSPIIIGGFFINLKLHILFNFEILLNFDQFSYIFRLTVNNLLIN